MDSLTGGSPYVPQVPGVPLSFVAVTQVSSRVALPPHATYEPRQEKTCLLGSDHVRLKPACSATETSYSLEITAIACIGIILSK